MKLPWTKPTYVPPKTVFKNEEVGGDPNCPHDWTEPIQSAYRRNAEYIHASRCLDCGHQFRYWSEFASVAHEPTEC